MHEATSTSTSIKMTIEEEQKRKTRVLHTRVICIKDTENVEEVKGLLQHMGFLEATHTSAWRVGEKGTYKLRIRFPNNGG